MIAAPLVDAAERSASPAFVRTTFERITTTAPAFAERLATDEGLLEATTAVIGASRELATFVVADDAAASVLADLDTEAALEVVDGATLQRWKRLEYLRIAARDLLGLDDVATTTALVSALARSVLQAAVRIAGPPEGRFCVIGMGKLGADELNYASDIDVMFVADGADQTVLERAARRVMELSRGSFRVDANLRPQGRDGPLVRTADSYDAYWQRWAEPWEFQALLKAAPVAGDEQLAAEFDALRVERLWGRAFSADDLRSLRQMKARVEAEVSRKGLTELEVKRGRGGIRDVEFSIQLLQLVHGHLDPAIRVPGTLPALAELSAAGYVDGDDASRLGDAYVFLRTVEHRLQLYDGQQVYALPTDDPSRERIARSMRWRDTVATSALDRLDAELVRHRATVRTIHERLYFRPLLEAFTDPELGALSQPGAIDARLTAFGFSDALRTKAAVRDLTRGLTRASRLMQQMLPLLLGWLADSPDPDLGLLCLRNLLSGRGRSEPVLQAFRESAEAARRLCLAVGTSRLFAEAVTANPDLVARLPDVERLRTQERAVLVDKAKVALGWRTDDTSRQEGLRRWKDRNLVGVMARDLFGSASTEDIGADITRIAETSLEVALELVAPQVPFAVVALGRFGGAELSYASDLDVVFVYDGDGATDQREAERVAFALRKLVGGATPAARIWEIDCDLRPEGKQGLLARSLGGYGAYFERWALMWERQAMARARPVAGAPAVGTKFMALLDEAVWQRPLTADDEREIRRLKSRVERERIPPGDDPQFHLKLGRGSLSDVEWTAQLLQLRNGVRAPSTIGALHLLTQLGHLDPTDRDVLVDAYRFCERTRNRWFLVKGDRGDSLPTQPERMRWLARALDTTPTELREHYRRVTRRSRSVMERLFYGMA